MNQREMKQDINIGGMGGVMTVASWYKHKHFKNDDEVRGAFRLAYQQGLDGMGKSIPKWMGLTEVEYAAWMKDDSLPTKKRKITLKS
jgi:hypothetical protein